MRLTLVMAASLVLAPNFSTAAEQDAASLYQARCAFCHDKPVDRVPGRDTLKSLPADAIDKALTTGAMAPMAQGLSREQIRDIAAYLGAAPIATAAAGVAITCTAPAGRYAIRDTDWNGWSRDLDSHRFQPRPGLSADEVPRLKVKWVHRYAGRSAYGQPTIVGGRVYLTSSTGRVSALDAKTGCELWGHEAGVGVKSAVMVADLGEGRFAAIFGDESAFAHAIDAETGKPLWKTKLDPHALARVTGHAKVHAGRVYMPVSSVEISVAGRNPAYPCCSFQGSLVALDAKTGAILWKTHSLTKPPAPFKKNSAGTQMQGPAGASIWSAPTLDVKRNLVYVGTGNSYTDVEDLGSNAIQALDMATGARKWVTQATPRDAYLVGCSKALAGVGNCPEAPGPDHDFGSAPILQTLPDGKQLLVASQKSGMVYGLEPDTGKIVWERRVGTGSALGGVEHDPAADGERVYVAVSDLIARPDPRPGLNALNPATGEVLWHVPTPEAKCAWGVARCARAQPAAVTAMPGIVFSGSFDGHIRAYEAATGKIVWAHDTGQAYKAVDGAEARGGSIDFGGTTIADGTVYVNSGYGLWGHIGHVLIAFTVDGH